MATKAVEAAKATATKAGPNFKVGQKPVYLPGHVVKMLPPRLTNSPYFATFQVPLRFNKLDLRDYLYHAYGVEVRSVRSWLTPQQPQRKYADEDRRGLDSGATEKLHAADATAFGRGAWFRPQPIKRMMVELVKPFAYPDPPAEATAATRGTEDDPRAAWDHAMFKRLEEQRNNQETGQRTRVIDKKFPMRVEEDFVPAFRVELAKQAQQLVRGERVWRSSAVLDEHWDAAATDGRAATAPPASGGPAKP